MKRIIIIFLFIGASQIVNSQDAPKNANLITIETSDNIDNAFRTMGRLLVNEGYELAMADRTFYMITTQITDRKYGMMGSGSLSVRFTLEFDEIDNKTAINIKGQFYSEQLQRAAGSRESNFDKDAERITNRGMRNSLLSVSWEMMNDIAKKYGNGDIFYSIEE